MTPSEKDHLIAYTALAIVALAFIGLALYIANNYS